MKTAKTKILSLGIFALLFGIFFINSLTAQSLIAGKVYNEAYSGIVAGASVLVTCGSASLETNSLEDETYAVRFNIGVCTLENSVKVAAKKNELTGEASGSVGDCDGQPCTDSDYLAVLNLMIKAPVAPAPAQDNNGGGGSAWRYYLCGNGKCDSGENEKTCPKDCKPKTNVTNTTAQLIDVKQGTINLTILNNTNQEVNVTNEDEPEFFPGITGAVAGTLGTAGIIGAFAFILVVILASVLVYKKRRASKPLFFHQQKVVI